MPSPEMPRPTPEKGFGFTEREALFDRVSDSRFRTIVADEQTTIHRVELSSNNYGEFMFVTVSREGEQEREYVTFFGQGFHEYRERWISQEWFLYKSSPWGNLAEERVERDEAIEKLNDRAQEIAPYTQEKTQSQRGELFETLADITDEDGAYSELQDLGDDLDDLFDE